MSILFLIFSTGAALLLFLSGFLKLLVINKSKNLFQKYNWMPEILKKISGYLFPFIEISLAIGLIFKNDVFLINVAAFLLFGCFIVENFNGIFNKENDSCYCFGNVIKSKYGTGGLIQSILLLFSVLPNLLTKEKKGYLLFSLEMKYLITIIVISIFWTLILMIIRKTVDNIGNEVTM